MKALFDTTVIIAGLVESHPMHARAFPWMKKAMKKEIQLVLAAHTLAESYAVLSSLPVKPRISAGVAWRLLKENLKPMAQVVALTTTEYWSTLQHTSESGLIGGIVYDALIARIAKKVRVERLVTFNSDHFIRIWPEGEKIIVAP